MLDSRALRAAACAAALLLTTQSSHAGLLQQMQKGKTSTAVQLDTGGDPAALAADLVSVEKGDKLAGQAKFALTGFTVEFQVMARDHDIMFGNTVASDAKLTAEGVSPEVMQRITDAAYAKFLDQAKARGIELVLPAELGGNSAWESIAKMGRGPVYEMTGENDRVRMVAPSGRTVIYPAPDEQSARLRWGVSGLAGMAQAQLPRQEIDLAKSIGAPAMKVHLVVKFGSAKAVTGLGATSGSGKVAGMILGDGQSAISIRTAKASVLPGMSSGSGGQIDGDAFVRLKTSIASPVDILAGPVRKGGSANTAAGNALVGLLGSGTTKADFVAPLDPQRYEEFAVGSLGRVTEMLTLRLKQAAGG